MAKKFDYAYYEREHPSGGQGGGKTCNYHEVIQQLQRDISILMSQKKTKQAKELKGIMTKLIENKAKFENLPLVLG